MTPGEGGTRGGRKVDTTKILAVADRLEATATVFANSGQRWDAATLRQQAADIRAVAASVAAEHVLISDDDGHWYVCPADRQQEAADTLQAIGDYWSKGDYSGDPPAMPAYLVEVGGAPSLVRFTGFRIG
jgi:hypothetical protein